MGRPEPCVLFAQTFVHPQLDEYVDEVIFAEPVVITACEFLEQNASSGSSAVALVGATSPPSFALEVFVQCEGETRFRRLCQPFLYSHSSSNTLEVEAVVSNHLVVRGSYRSLTLVIYGNTAEDLGQFNIEVDLDSSLTNVVCATEGRLEDLPPALLPIRQTIGEFVSPIKSLSLRDNPKDISTEIKQFLLLTLKILELPNLGDAINEVVNSVLSAASFYAIDNLHSGAPSQKQYTDGRSKTCGQSLHVIVDAQNKLQEIFRNLQHESGSSSADILADSMFMEPVADMVTSKKLVESLSRHLSFNGNSGDFEHPRLSQNVVLWLSAALFLCSAKESCFHFVNCGGMEQLGYTFYHGTGNSNAVTLLSLGVIEKATRHSIGCEGFLGWWPREDENVPTGVSEGYSQLLKLLMKQQRHDVASLATCILHRLHFYEVASRYEFAVLSLLGLSAAGRVTMNNLDMLDVVKLQLKKLLKLINMSSPIEDPSPSARASKSLMPGGAEGLLSHKATCSLITSSCCCFPDWEIDLHLLFLLKERGFLPLSAALLSSSILRSEMEHAKDIFLDIASSIEAIMLSLLFSRSGLVFLLLHPELSTTIILALRGADDLRKEESIPLRYASTLIAKGFFCHPREVGMIVETHLRVVNAVDRLLTLTRHSDEILWVLWELCALSRSDCGRHALLALGYFPEAVSVLIEAIHSTKEMDSVSLNSGASPLNHAIFHSAAEIFELLVTDSTASSLGSWIEHATELHKALHSSSPGSNRKDAPARLLEWIDAGVVYQKNGANGLLKYAAVLASGGDAHVASTSILSSDLVDIEHGGGDSSSSSDSNVIENLLRKPISEKAFPGVILRDSSVAQLTTSLRILAFISENSDIADALYDEGAIFVIHGVLIDCRLMLERLSINYDYLVDEGAECNSTSDLLLDRNREQSLVDLLVPSLVLLINLFERLQEAKELHRNTKLLSALIQLHREVSPKLAACAVDLTASYPSSALGLEAVCHLVVSALSYWPVYGWTPGLFHFLLDSPPPASLLALGPKETCSLLCLLNDMFPEEGVWIWKNGMPVLSALRALAVGTLLGPQKESQVNWYLKSGHCEVLLSHLTPQLDKIAHIVLHYATSTLVVIQDILRVFFVRIACLNADNASKLLQPMLLWISSCLSEQSPISDADAYKVYKLLDFVSGLLEHPRAKPILVEGGVIQILTSALERCIDAISSNEKQFLENRNMEKCGFSRLTWCIPVFKSLLLIPDPRISVPYPGTYDRLGYKRFTAEDCSLILSYILKLCKVLPVGKELLACLDVFRELVSCDEGRTALLSIFSHFRASIVEESESEVRHEKNGNSTFPTSCDWGQHPPLLCCLRNLLTSIESRDVPLLHVIEVVGALCSGALLFCMDGKCLNSDRLIALQYFFGLPCVTNPPDSFHEDNIKHVQELTTFLSSKINDEFIAGSDIKTTIDRVNELAISLLSVLEKPTESLKVDDIALSSLIDVPVSSIIHTMADQSDEIAEDYNLGGLVEKLMWDCPENLRDRLSQAALPAKRKISSLEGANRRSRGENAPADTASNSAFSRGSGPPTAPSGPTRRDTFRQRKPNTSRPPSMHVDDYVARERNDGTNNSNVIAVPRVGSNSGRPPSIHVDEFMARQRERHINVGTVVGDSVIPVKNVPSENDMSVEKSDKPRHLKADPDDDLQGIDIVFEGEESESDDKLPFLQPDDNLQQPPSVTVEHSPPRSIVEETESDVNGSSQVSRLGTPLTSNVDENNQSEFSSRMSVSRPEMPLTREPSISSDKKYNEHPDDGKSVPVNSSIGIDFAASGSFSGFPASASSARSPADPRMPPPTFYSKNSSQPAGIVPSGSGSSQGPYDQKYQLIQPPLPPMPPPPTVAPVFSQVGAVSSQSSPFVNRVTDVQPQQPLGFNLREDRSSLGSSAAGLLSPANLSSIMGSLNIPFPQVQADYANSMPDSKYARTSLSSSPSGSARPPPPLPPTPPPYSATSSTLPSMKTSASQSSVYNQSGNVTTEPPQTSVGSLHDGRLSNISPSGSLLTSYQPPPLLPPFLFNRPTSMPISIYGNSPTSHQGENPPIMSQNLPISLPSIQSLAQLQPLQPPQLPRPPQPPQHLRPPISASSQSEQGAYLLQNPVQMQVQPLQILQQPQASQFHGYYHNQHQENFSHAQVQQQVEHTPTQVVHQLGDGSSQQQQDNGMSLQHFFSSPEAIQSLLSDRDKLCQLLEQHPKLMQMLQERLGQL